MPGRLITVEGIEGVGKSTHLEFIAEHLRAAEHVVRVTREPGGTPVAEQLRRLMLHAQEPLPDEAELLLLFAARAVHLRNLIRPALARGEWVLCDRFTDATRAYQGGGRGQPEQRIETLASWVHGDLEPDLTLLLDAPLEIAGHRRRARGEQDDRFEREADAFFSRVRERYLALAQRWPQRIRRIDASADVRTVQQSLAEVLNEFLERTGRSDAGGSSER